MSITKVPPSHPPAEPIPNPPKKRPIRKPKPKPRPKPDEGGLIDIHVKAPAWLKAKLQQKADKLAKKTYGVNLSKYVVGVLIRAVKNDRSLR